MLIAGLLVPALLLAPAAITPTPAPSPSGEVLLRLPAPVVESSGVASSSRSADLLFTHNDSGDEGRFFAVSLEGELQATHVLPGVEARDWEDMARGPDEQGRSSLWLGDIGDNSAARDLGLLVHRVPEPDPSATGTVQTPAPTSFRLRYDDGPRDAEALLVHPRTGRLYVVSKEVAGNPGVYAAPERLDPAGPNALTRIGELALPRTTTEGGPGAAAGLALVTAGDIAPDGSRVAVRTYTDLYEWPLAGDDLAAALATAPAVTPLPPTGQGEALAYTADGAAVLLSTEGAGAPVHRVPVAELPGGAASPEPSGAADGPPPMQERDVPWGALALAGGLGLGLGLLALALALRPRRRDAGATRGRRSGR